MPDVGPCGGVVVAGVAGRRWAEECDGVASVAMRRQLGVDQQNLQLLCGLLLFPSPFDTMNELRRMPNEPDLGHQSHYPTI